MSKLAKRVNSVAFQNGVRQYRAVLDFLTDIEDEMHRTGLNQSEFAERLGKSRAWVSKVLRQQPNLTFFTAVELATALNLEVEVRAVQRAEVRSFRMTQEQPEPSGVGAGASAFTPHLRLVSHRLQNNTERDAA